MDKVNVLVIAPCKDADLERIKAVDPRLNVLDGRGKFEHEYLQTWPEETTRLYVRIPTIEEAGLLEVTLERDALLRQAEVVCIAFPYPTTLVSRSPGLKWVHQIPAGASNLRYGDLWGSQISVSTSRGYTNSTAHAEWALATVLAFTKDFPQAFVDKQNGELNRAAFRPRLLAGKTIGVVGLGGIGKEVARLAKALGMRVVATRRSIDERTIDADGVALFPPGELHALLGESDYVVIAVQSTQETDGLIGWEAIKAMKRTAYLVNLARGEIINEDALIEALRKGLIAGAALDVYVGEFERPPRPELMARPNVILTPHVSGGTDVPTHRGIELFCENLSRYVAGQELVNVINWERGY